MLHLHAVSPVPGLGLEIAAADALVVSTLHPGKMARVTFFEGDFMQVVKAMENGQLTNVGEPLTCAEVEDFVARALGESPPTQAPSRPTPKTA